MSALARDVLAAAVRNNAAWCDLFARLHGVEGVFQPQAWTSASRTPDGYPDAVTLRERIDVAWLLSRIDLSPGSSVKDSYGDLDLAPWGFERLFGASWIHRTAAVDASQRPKASWSPVRSDAVLAAWEAAWGRPPTEPRLFPAGLLARDDVVVLASGSRDVIEAGAILSAGGGAVGVSNLFVVQQPMAEGSALAAVFADTAAIAAEFYPGAPIVGYQRGERLAAAIDAGFEPLGPLAVWLRP